MNKLISIFFISLIASQSVAYTSTSGGAVQITDLRVYGTDIVLFKAAEAQNLDNCNGKDAWIMVKQETEAQKRQFTVLLSARVAQQPVTLFFSGCSEGGVNGYRLLEQVLF